MLLIILSLLFNIRRRCLFSWFSDFLSLLCFFYSSLTCSNDNKEFLYFSAINGNNAYHYFSSGFPHIDDYCVFPFIFLFLTFFSCFRIGFCLSTNDTLTRRIIKNLLNGISLPYFFLSFYLYTQSPDSSKRPSHMSERLDDFTKVVQQIKKQKEWREKIYININIYNILKEIFYLNFSSPTKHTYFWGVSHFWLSRRRLSSCEFYDFLPLTLMSFSFCQLFIFLHLWTTTTMFHVLVLFHFETDYLKNFK